MRNSWNFRWGIQKIDGNVIYVNFGKKIKRTISEILGTVPDLEWIEKYEEDARPSVETIQKSTLPFKNWFLYFINMEELIDDEINKAAFMKLWETAKTLDDYCTLYRLLFDSGYIEYFEKRIHSEFDITADLLQSNIEDVMIKKNNKTAEYWKNEYDFYRDYTPHYAYLCYQMLINMIDVKNADYIIDLPHDLKIK